MSTDIRITTLDNGLRIITDTMKTVETVSVGAWVNAGARNEAPEINGISHMLEHMAFKGTKRRSARDIATEIEDVGGYVNAYTSREQTAYYAKLLKEDIGLAIDIIADILQHSTMDAVELERERTVILQEISQANDTPDDIVFDHFQETAFPDQAMGRPVLGSPQNVSGFERDTLFGYMRTHYAPEGIVIAAAGNLDHDQLVELVANAFDSLPASSAEAYEPVRYVGGDFRKNRDLDQVHILMGLEGMSYDDPDFHAVSVYATLFGGGMSSRLFQEIRETRGLAYSVYAFGSSYADGGLFGIYAGTGEKEAADLPALICDELLKSADDITEEEVSRASSQLKSSLLMGLESTSSRCEQAARQLHVFGRAVPIEETVEKIDLVGREQVMSVARRLAASPLTFAAIGPTSRIESFDNIQARLA
ncbi:MAG: pitrilysin family protein [Rhodospirillales bacterium]